MKIIAKGRCMSLFIKWVVEARVQPLPAYVNTSHRNPAKSTCSHLVWVVVALELEAELSSCPGGWTAYDHQSWKHLLFGYAS